MKTALAGRNYSHIKGDYVDVPDKIGANWLEHKVAVNIGTFPAGADVKKHPDPIVETPEGETPLPEDTPSYELLIENELKTVEAVLAHENLQSITGIGAKTKEAILNHLKPE